MRDGELEENTSRLASEGEWSADCNGVIPSQLPHVYIPRWHSLFFNII